MVTESSFFKSFTCLHGGKNIDCWYGSNDVFCRVPSLLSQPIPILTEATGGLRSVSFKEDPKLKPENVHGKTHNFVCAELGKKIHGKPWKGTSMKI